MIIAYVADEHYLPYLRRSIESVKKYNPKAKIVVLSRQVFQVPGADVYPIKPDINQFKYRQKHRI